MIELKQGLKPKRCCSLPSTPLQNTFGINLLALVDGEPRLLNEAGLRLWEHRLTVVRRRSEFDGQKKAQAHILGDCAQR